MALEPFESSRSYPRYPARSNLAQHEGLE